MSPNSPPAFLSWLTEGHASFERQDTLPQATLLTVPVVLLYGSSAWFVGIPVAVLSLAALVFPSLRTRATLWSVVACFLLAGVSAGWTHEDNHKYLIAYWAVALACAGTAADGAQGLVRAARLLIGLTFAFALLAKARSGDFWSGDFFHYSLLFDARFSGKLVALGVLDEASRRFNDVARQALLSPTSDLLAAKVASNGTVRALAAALTGWTLAIEAVIAFTFLVPARWRLARLRDSALLLFIGSAYAVAPVLGFATVLSAMGFVQCERERRRTRLAYLVCFVGTQLFRIPWAALLSPRSSLV
jgi:uncharacterized protein YfiM (DUF2279 family)